MKMLLALLATLLAGVALYFAFGEAQPLAELDPGVQTPEESSEPQREPAVLAAGENSAAEPATIPGEQREALAVVPHESEVDSAEAKDARVITGRVIVTDESGAEWKEATGAIVLDLWVGNTGKSVTLSLVQGQFSTKSDSFDYFTVDDLDLNGRKAALTNPEQEYREHEDVVVYAHWPKLTTLSVIGDDTGVHLTDVTLIANDDWRTDDFSHPGAIGGETIVERQNSPIELTQPTGQVLRNTSSYFVHSPGYAWKLVRLYLANGGEREVRLQPGGTVEVRLIGALPKGKQRLRLHRLEHGALNGVPYTEAAANPNKVTSFEGLRTGDYQVRVEAGDWFQRPAVLGKTPFSLNAGDIVSVDVVLDPVEEIAKARIAGTIELPQAWNLEDFQLEAEPKHATVAGEMKTVTLDRSDMQGGGSRWSFEFRPLPVGAYELILYAGGWPRTFEIKKSVSLPPDGLDDVHFEVGPPAQVVLLLINGENGEPAEISSVHWSAIDAGENSGTGYVNVSPVEPGRFEITMPVGEATVGAFATGFTSLNERLTIQPGVNEFTITVHRECPLTIVFLDGETVIPMPDEYWFPDPDHLDGDGELLYVSGNTDGEYRTALGEPGRYVFEIPEFDGYEPIPDQTITVKRGEVTRHVVQLVRKR